MQILNGVLDCGSAEGSAGGTEVMARRVASLDPELLEKFQIVVSRVENEELEVSKIRIYYVHDLPRDPAADHLAHGGWSRWHKIVFVSNWQMQAYIRHYHIPWSRCVVLHNAIDPVGFNEERWDDPVKVRLIYHSAPHRGLEILLPVFQELCERFPLELDVFSSFDLYGWRGRGEKDPNRGFAHLFNACKAHPLINYHGTQDNHVVRAALREAHIFAFPSIWPETSCLCLMEAMSAGCMCVHSNFAALPETAANWTHMYQFSENILEHVDRFCTSLGHAIEDVKDGGTEVRDLLRAQKAYADTFYSWANREAQWEGLLRLLLAEGV